MGANFLIVDDYLSSRMAKSDQERETALNSFNPSFKTRLNNQNEDVIIVIEQRLHERDLSGMLLKEGGFEHLCLQGKFEKRQTISFGNFKRDIEDNRWRVLDACCGFGMLSRAISDKGFIVSGFDIDPNLLKMYNNLVGASSTVKDFTNEEVINASALSEFNIVSNPPYEIREAALFFEWLSCALKPAGIAILILPKGFMDRDKPKALVEYFSDF